MLTLAITLTNPIDASRLKSDINALIADCIHLKTLLRTRWTRPMAEEQKRLARVRRKLTDLFILLAASRKRLHIIHAPREVRDSGGPDFDLKAWDAAAYNATIANRLLPEYAVAVLVSTTASEAAAS
jgi:hypothetical protein